MVMLLMLIYHSAAGTGAGAPALWTGHLSLRPNRGSGVTVASLPTVVDSVLTCIASGTHMSRHLQDRNFPGLWCYKSFSQTWVAHLVLIK